LNVTANEKSTGKYEKITITNDKGRLSAEDIERMVQEAEKCKEEDDRIKKSIEEKAALENYLYSVKKQVNEDLKDKLSETDKSTINEKIREVEKEMDDRTYRDGEYYDNLRKDLSDMLQNMISSTNIDPNVNDTTTKPSPMNSEDDGPKIEEVD